MDRDSRKSGRRGGGGRSPPRQKKSSRRRSRSRDSRRSGEGSNNKSEERERMRELLLSEAAKRNPDAASVLSSNNSDREALQRALVTATSLSLSQHQQQQQLMSQQGHQQRNQRFPNNNSRYNDSEKELYVAGLPDQLLQDEDALLRFLNDAAIKRSFNIESGNPVVSVRINPGRHAFAVFRSKEEATKCLELNGIESFGSTLKVDRPKGFVKQGPVPQMDENQMIAAVLASTPLPNMTGMTKEELKNKLEESIGRLGESTSLVELSNLEGAGQAEVEMEAKKHGSVVGVRASVEKPGAFLVKMSNIQEAESLVQLKRAYEGRRVQACFRPLVEWTS